MRFVNSSLSSQVCRHVYPYLRGLLPPSASFFDGVSGCPLFPASLGGDFGRFIFWCDLCVFIRTQMVNVNDSEGGGGETGGMEGDGER